MSLTEAWTWGNDGQCSCASSGAVLCKDVTSAPFFAVEYRKDKMLTLMTNDAVFDTTSLKDTVGFRKVIVAGLSSDRCREMTLMFPWSQCLMHAESTPMMRVTVTSWTRADVEGLGSLNVDDRELAIGAGHTSRGPSTAVIVWITLSTILAAILTCCILASLVNLHARINSHAHANDPALCAIDCCLKCMALLIFPYTWLRSAATAPGLTYTPWIVILPLQQLPSKFRWVKKV